VDSAGFDLGQGSPGVFIAEVVSILISEVRLCETEGMQDSRLASDEIVAKVVKVGEVTPGPVEFIIGR